MSVSTLQRPLYSVPEAARLLDLPSATLRSWLQGATRQGQFYPPVIRAEPGPNWVSWGDFVEAGLLRNYRRKRVPLQRMRPFIARMRETTGVPYPLAHFRPLIDEQRQLVYDAQVRSELPRALYLVQFEGGQMQLAEPVLAYLDTVDFDPDGSVARVRPFGHNTPVVIDPEIQYGIPQIGGIRTELIAETVAAGETTEQAARAWGIAVADVEAALSWERRLAAAA